MRRFIFEQSILADRWSLPSVEIEHLDNGLLVVSKEACFDLIDQNLPEQ